MVKPTMAARTNKGVAGIIVGVLIIIAGGYFIVFPKAGFFFQLDEESGQKSLLRMSQEASRIYGALGVVLGLGLIWLARWPRWGGQRAAIEDYYWGLSQELSQHFGLKQFYRLDEVSRIADESGCAKAYMAFAHAMFCSRPDFDAYYEPLHVACTYDGLRRVISRRYFDGALGFDAATIVRLTTPPKAEEYNFTENAGG